MTRAQTFRSLMGEFNFVFPSARIMPISKWSTPATVIPEDVYKNVFIQKRIIPAGSSLDMAGTFGYDRCVFLEDCPITVIREGGGLDNEGVWMSDSPMEYFGMSELASRCRGGHVLIGGLGLGLLPQLLYRRLDVRSITVVEIDPRIIHLMHNWLPPGVAIVEGDVIDLLQTKRDYDSIIIDIFRSDADTDTFTKVKSALSKNYPNTQQLFWAFQDTQDRCELEGSPIGSAFLKKLKASMLSESFFSPKRP